MVKIYMPLICLFPEVFTVDNLIGGIMAGIDPGFTTVAAVSQ